MKSLPASLMLSATAIMQALAIFRYTENTMSFTGQVFFPVLFALMAVYISWKNRERSGRFAVLHIIIVALAVVALAASFAGMTASLYYFYPSAYVYYVALGLLVLELGLRIAALPKKDKPVREPRRKKTQRSTNLVAVKKDAGNGSTPAGE